MEDGVAGLCGPAATDGTVIVEDGMENGEILSQRSTQSPSSAHRIVNDFHLHPSFVFKMEFRLLEQHYSITLNIVFVILYREIANKNCVYITQWPRFYLFVSFTVHFLFYLCLLLLLKI